MAFERVGCSLLENTDEKKKIEATKLIIYTIRIT